jgi:hypothetical protein
MKYTELEEKVIAKGKKQFRIELEEASKPMLAVLKKYKIMEGHPLLKKITLWYPYSDGYSFAVNIPADDELNIESTILNNFMNDISKLKQQVEDLEI